MSKELEVRNEQTLSTSVVEPSSGLNPEPIWEESNYIPLEDFAKYGKTKRSEKSKRWSKEHFYKALANLKQHKKDVETVDNPKVCLVGSIYTPCYAKDSTETFKTNDSTTYFLKVHKSWGFKYDVFPQFVKRYYKEIDKLINKYEKDKVDEKVAKKEKKRYMKEYGLTNDAEFVIHIMRGVK